MSTQLETKCKLAGAKILSRSPALIDTRGDIPKQLRIDMCRCVHPCASRPDFVAKECAHKKIGTSFTRHNSEVTGRRTDGRKVAIISKEHTNAAIFSYDDKILRANEEWIQVNFDLFLEHNGARSLMRLQSAVCKLAASMGCFSNNAMHVKRMRASQTMRENFHGKYHSNKFKFGLHLSELFATTLKPAITHQHKPKPLLSNAANEPVRQR